MSFTSDAAFGENAFHHNNRIHLPVSNVDMGNAGVHSSDTVIDAALRSVPLPDGLMIRLGRWACTIDDEAADQVDWLGC